MKNVGFKIEAFEAFGENGWLVPAENLIDLRNLHPLVERMKKGEIKVMMLAPPCKTWGILGQRNGATRTKEDPEGRNLSDWELEGTLNGAVGIFLFIVAVKFRIWVFLEHPEASFIWLVKIMKILVNLHGLGKHPYDGCAWCLRQVDDDYKIKYSTYYWFLHFIASEMHRGMGWGIEPFTGSLIKHLVINRDCK